MHLANINCQPVLSRELLTRGEVVDFLILVQPLVEIVFALSVRPEHVPVVAVGGHKTVYLKEEPH